LDEATYPEGDKEIEVLNLSRGSSFNVWFGFMVFNSTFNNISVIWWRSVLMVEETAVPRENHQPVASH
jgi:hypothetical protein